MAIDLNAIKFICAAVCAILTFIGTALVMFIKAPRLTERAESLAGGVFLGAAFAHLFQDSTSEIYQYGKMKYPISGALTIGTFVVLTTIEIFSYSEHDFKDKKASGDEDVGDKKLAVKESSGDESHDTSDVVVDLESPLNDIVDNPLPRSTGEDSDSSSELVLFSKKLHSLSFPVSILFIIMLVHSFIEGLALGIMKQKRGVIAIACAVGGHKPVEAFALGLIVVKEKPVQWLYWLMMFLYVAMSPLGIVVAVYISQFGNMLVLGIISAISAGTFTFVGCDEWSRLFYNKDKWSVKDKLWHLGLFSLGVLWMLLIAIVDN